MLRGSWERSRWKARAAQIASQHDALGGPLDEVSMRSSLPPIVLSSLVGLGANIFETGSEELFQASVGDS